MNVLDFPRSSVRRSEESRADGRDDAQGVQAQERRRARAHEGPEHGPIGDERGDQQRVDRQPRGARHERRDEDRGQAVPLVLHRARRQDRRHRAGVAGEEGQERPALQAHAVHHPIGDHGRPGHVARVLEDAEEEEEDQDLRKEDQHRSHAGPHAVDEQVANPRVRQMSGHPRPRGRDQPLDPVHERRRPREDRLEDQRARRPGRSAAPRRGAGARRRAAPGSSRGPRPGIRPCAPARAPVDASRRRRPPSGAGRPAGRSTPPGTAVPVSAPRSATSCRKRWIASTPRPERTAACTTSTPSSSASVPGGSSHPAAPARRTCSGRAAWGCPSPGSARTA